MPRRNEEDETSSESAQSDQNESATSSSSSSASSPSNSPAASIRSVDSPPRATHIEQLQRDIEEEADSAPPKRKRVTEGEEPVSMLLTGYVLTDLPI